MADAYLYTWHRDAQKWEFRAIHKSEADAREEGRLLWKAGAAGIKIDVLQTVVCEKRT